MKMAMGNDIGFAFANLRLRASPFHSLCGIIFAVCPGEYRNQYARLCHRHFCFSGGDEPDGSGKFITAFFRNPEIKDGVTRLLEERDGLICGICFASSFTSVSFAKMRPSP